MPRLFAIIAIFACCLIAAPADAQLGAHKKINSSADAKSRFKKKALERNFQFDEARNSYKPAVASNSGYGEAKRRLERANRLWPAE